MQNSIQSNNSGQQWHNEAFKELFGNITERLPNLTFWAIIFSYLATAALNCWAIHLPLFLTVPLSLAIQSLRFLTVFTPFLNPHGRASHLPEVIALGASLLALFELSFSLQAMGETAANFWSLFLFGAAILVLSMVLELQFIKAGKRAFGLTAQKVSSGGAVSMGNQANQTTTLPDPHIDVQALEDEIEFLRDQVKQMQTSNQGNGQAPSPRRKTKVPSSLLNGHSGSSNGNGQKP